jgi:hypothetical protein
MENYRGGVFLMNHTEQTVPGKNKPLVSAEGGCDNILHADASPKPKGPRPLLELLISPVITSVSNYVALG